jgi:redox-sensitive bicupin YhaK (pirin superfamily)
VIDLRPFQALPATHRGWLQARHHFPVDGRDDPLHAPVGSLYVWNDDEFAAGHGFPLHSHQDVEIITYVRAGAVTHTDTLGNVSEIRAGEVQVMSAGAGVRHSEVNRGEVPLKVFQIWIAPNELGGPAAYATRAFPDRQEPTQLAVLASGFAEDSSSRALPLRAQARVLAARLEAGKSMRYVIPPRRDLYLVAAKGVVSINGVRAGEGDGVAITREKALELAAADDAELVIVEVE